MKLCEECYEFKSERHFRYIKYYDARRRICKKCEARLRQRKRKETIRHVKETGFTPNILRRLKDKASADAAQQAREKVLKALPLTKRKIFRTAEIAKQILNIVLLVVGFLAPFVVLVQIELVVPLIIGFAILTGGFGISRSITAPIRHDIDKIKAELYRSILEQEKQKRIEVERFYSSREWQTLRKEFLRIQKLKNRSYVCHYCGHHVSEDDLTVDHFKPRSKFPELALKMANLRVAHRSCNSAKGVTIIPD